MAQPLGVAELHRLPDRGQTERLAGVDRQVEVFALDEVEGAQVLRRREAILGPGDVEAADAPRRGSSTASSAIVSLRLAWRIAERIVRTTM